MPFGLTKETKSNHIFYYLNNDYYCQIIYCILYVDFLFYFDCFLNPPPPPPPPTYISMRNEYTDTLVISSPYTSIIPWL